MVVVVVVVVVVLLLVAVLVAVAVAVVVVELVVMSRPQSGHLGNGLLAAAKVMPRGFCSPAASASSSSTKMQMPPRRINEDLLENSCSACRFFNFLIFLVFIRVGKFFFGIFCIWIEHNLMV